MEETVILNFEVDQSKALKDLQKTEKAILNLKEEQSELNKEYKAGKVSQDEYVKENIKLQSSLKKENDQKRALIKALETESNSRNAMRARVADLTKEYNNLNLATEKGKKRADDLQKELKDLNETLNQGSKAAGNFKDNIGNYPQQFGEAIKTINVAGVSVGDLGSKLGSFINPATAVIGVLGGLTAAYAASTTGAKDLARAQDILGFASTSLIEGIGKDLGGGDGLSGVLLKITSFFSESSAAVLGTAARAGEQLRELEVQLVNAQGFAKTFEKVAEEARIKRDNDQNELTERLRQTDVVEQGLVASGNVRTNILKQQITLIKNTNADWQDNLDIQKELAERNKEIRDIEEEITGKLTENKTARANLITLLKDQEAAQRRIDRLATRPDGALVGDSPQVSDVPLAQPSTTAEQTAIEGQKKIADQIVKIQKESYEADLKNKKAAAELKAQIDQQQLANTAAYLAQGASLFEENTAAYKIFATTSTLISTYSAAQKAYEAAFLPVPTVASPALGAAFAAIAVANGLANVAQINGLEFAEGGFTGAGGKYEPAGIVHKGEYVVPQSVNYSPAAQPHIAALESMRMKGYADGGFVASQNIASSQQALMTANMLKNMPAPVVSVKEVTKVQNRVSAREKLARQR